MSELYAEIERLTRELEHEVSISRRANNRLVDLDTEIERLTRELEMKQLVENRLRLSWDESDKDAKRLTRDLYEEVVENERLRAALINAIAPYATWGERVPPWVADAREALGEPKP